MSAAIKYAFCDMVPVNDNEISTMPRVVGLMGYGSAGKSEVRKALCERHGYQARHIKQPIADMTAVLLRYAGLSNVTTYIDGAMKRDPIPELGGRTATEIQQFIGTELGRVFCHPDLWLNIWQRWASGVIAGGGRVVQESVRFANEAKAVRQMGGVIVEIRRPGVGPLNDHVSEALPVEPDVVIENNGTLADLAAAVGRL